MGTARKSAPLPTLRVHAMYSNFEIARLKLRQLHDDAD
jgi:hypothetical protein